MASTPPRADDTDATVVDLEEHDRDRLAKSVGVLRD